MTTLSLRTVLNHHVFRYSIMSRLPHATLATQHVTSCRSTCSANLSCYRRADKRSQLAGTPASAMPLSTSSNIFTAATIVNAGARGFIARRAIAFLLPSPLADDDRATEEPAASSIAIDRARKVRLHEHHRSAHLLATPCLVLPAEPCLKIH